MDTVELEIKEENTPKNIIRVINFSTFAAAITTYSHFFGYSFLKGRLNAMGYGNTEINLSLNESLHQTAYALTNMISKMSPIEPFKQLVPLAIIIGIMFFMLDIMSQRRKEQPQDTSWLSVFSAQIMAKAHIIRPTFAFLIGLLTPYIAITIFFIALSLSWVLLIIGEALGTSSISPLISNGVCIHQDDFDWKSTKKVITRGCVELSSKEGDELTGVIIYSDDNRTFLLTNESAIEMDSHRAIISKVQFIRRPSEN